MKERKGAFREEGIKELRAVNAEWQSVCHIHAWEHQTMNLLKVIKQSCQNHTRRKMVCLGLMVIESLMVGKHDSSQERRGGNISSPITHTVSILRKGRVNGK